MRLARTGPAAWVTLQSTSREPTQTYPILLYPPAFPNPGRSQQRFVTEFFRALDRPSPVARGRTTGQLGSARGNHEKTSAFCVAPRAVLSCPLVSAPPSWAAS